MLSGCRCEICPLQKRRLPIEGSGNGKTLMIIGETPGEIELVKKIPFIGTSGQLVRKILDKIDETDTYYTYAVMCRPHKNETPDDKAISACNERLHLEIKSVNPKYILILGNTALKAVTGKDPRTVRRGDWFVHNGRQVIFTYHPSAVLRSPRNFAELRRAMMKLKRKVSAWSFEKALKFKVVENPAQLVEYLQKRDARLGFDTETTSKHWNEAGLVCCGFQWDNDDTVVITYAKHFYHPDVIDTLIARFRDTVFIGSNIVNYDARCLLEWLGDCPDVMFDTLLAQYIVDENLSKKGLKDLANYYFDAHDWDKPMEKFITKVAEAPKNLLEPYQAYDLLAGTMVAAELDVRIDEEEVRKPWETIILPSAPMLARMSHTGIRVDLDYLSDLGKKYKEDIKAAKEELAKTVNDSTFNANSPKQVAHLLYDVLGMTKAYGGTTDAKTMDKLRKKYEDPVIDQIINVRHLTKILSTYIVGLSEAADDMGFVHTTFNLNGTGTGRLSSSNPINLQNIPKRLGPEIRMAFIPDEDWQYIADIDYSQLEVRVGAHVSNDEKLIEFLKSGQDLHYQVASMIYHLPIDQISKLQRTLAKAGTFGVMYGMDEDAAVWNLGITKEEAKELIAGLKRVFEGLNKWSEKTILQALTQHFVTTMFGRKRRFPVITDANIDDIRKQAVNTPIQSAASDICLLACNRIDKEKVYGFSPRLLVHDSIVGIAYDRSCTKRVVEIMQDVPFKTEVPFLVEAEVTKRWGEPKE